VGRVWGGQRTVAVIDAIDTGRRGGFDPEVVDATTFPTTSEDEASTGKSTMSAWSTDALRMMAATNDLHISPGRGDGKTYGTPTWMWPVAVDDARGEESVSVAFKEVTSQDWAEKVDSRHTCSKTIVRRKQCNAQQCFYRFVSSFQLVLL
jgi:hypothetical protein